MIFDYVIGIRSLVCGFWNLRLLQVGRYSRS